MRNTTVNNNGSFGIAAFQRRLNPTEIKNLQISHCTFVDNNPSNQTEGHTIYFEKLKNSVFENISVVMPAGNNWIGIDINLLSRLDYSNISILNSRITRLTPGSGIWIQARNDLPDPPAMLDTVLIRGMIFTNCDTNIAFNHDVKNMTVDKCDLSTYSRYGLVNFADPGGTINADNNKWKNGGTPDTTVISRGMLANGSNIIAAMPSTNGIVINMGITGTGIPPGTLVTSVSPTTVTMSNPATTNGTVSPIIFAFNFATSTSILRTSLNFITTGNPLPNTIVNQVNVSFNNLNDAISGTSGGGTIWNLPAGLIGGITLINKNLKLIAPGAGFLHAPSLTTFEVLSVQTDSFKMGSDFAVSGSFVNRGSNNNSNGFSGTTFIGEDNTLLLNGSINSGALIVGGARSDIFVGGTCANAFLPGVIDGLRTLQLNRTSGISLSDSLRLHRLLFLQNGLLSLADKNLTLDPNATIFAPFTSTSYVNTNGIGELRKDLNSSTPTFFLFTIGSGSYSPASLFFSGWNPAIGSFVSSRVVNSKHPYNGCITDYLNRYWVMSQNGISIINANAKFSYVDGDVVGNEANIDGARFNGFLWNTYGPLNAAANTFTTGNLNSFGDFSGGSASCLNSNSFTEVNTKVILQGSYDGGGNMRISLNTLGFIPLSQPYNTSQYNYYGSESVVGIPAGVVDWVYLELRSTAAGLPVTNGRRAAFIKSDGSLVDIDGISHVKFPGLIAGNYFVVVGHRIHLPVMSNNAEPLNTSSNLYDFTDGLSKYYEGEAKNLGDGFFAMYGRLISTLINNEFKAANYYTLKFTSNGLSSGVYFYTIKTEKNTETKKMTLIK
ncbi:MAG: hypothetical protein M3R36_13745 [Bacteroidota bacterium]|nr:hypothetical protein [Bacteroidota bacterium]